MLIYFIRKHRRISGGMIRNALKSFTEVYSRACTEVEKTQFQKKYKI
jgi:hypothetical protein